MALGAAVALMPAGADAHTRLVRSDPSDGAVLSRAPEAIRLTFSEALLPAHSSARVLDRYGREVSGVRVRVDPARPATLVVSLPRVRPGPYSTIFAASGRDGHRSRGLVAVRTSRGGAPARAAAPQDELAPAAVVSRWIDFALVAGLVGGLTVALLVLGGGGPAAMRRRVLAFAAACGAAALTIGLAALPLQALVLMAWEPATGPSLLLDTRWGALWLAREALIAALVALALWLRREPRAAAAAPAALAVLAPILMVVRALDGHAADVSPHTALAVLTLALHVLAAAVWLGGLAALAVGSWPVLRRRDREATAALLRAVWAPFAGLAIAAVWLLAATGVYTAGRQVASVDALIATLYGQTLLVKLGLLLLTGTFGLLTASVVHPPLAARLGRIVGAAPSHVRTLVLAEVGAGLTILLAAALMSSAAPGRGPEFEPAASAPGTLSRTSGDLLVALRVTPNRPGQNAYSVIAASTERPARPAPSAVELRFPGGAAVRMTGTAPGRFHSAGEQLSAAGPARIEVAVQRAGEPDRVVGFGWSVGAGVARRHTTISDRPLEPLLTLAAALLLLAGVATGVRVHWPPGRPRSAAARLSVPLVLALALILFAAPRSEAAAGALDAEVAHALATLAPGEKLPVVVRLAAQERPRPDAGTRRERLERLIRALRAQADGEQRALRTLLALRRVQGRVSDIQAFWVFNGVAVHATGDVILEIAARPDVERVGLDATGLAPADAVEANLALVDAPALWQLGHRGVGIVVAGLDSGVDHLHPDLSAQWRGGSNSWFDPSGQHPDTPADMSGHGTATMGVMVGRAASGTAIGMAPDAKWIAAKIFDDQGATTVSRIHAAFQWLLDPDHNPATADAPHVVNNSWTFSSPGCNLEFRLDLEALRAAGIVPVFAAGNAGPAAGTSRSPANNPGAFAVGAVDDGSLMYPGSSRGPSACTQDGGPYPELVAPGVDIWTSDRFGVYAGFSGTSLAAPHVTGALALLLGAKPGATAAEQETALTGSAADLGVSGPDDDFGHGGLDVRAALELMPEAPPPPPPPPPPPAPIMELSVGTPGPSTVGDVAGVGGEDVLSFTGADFDLLLDGSDVGLPGIDVEAFARLDSDSFLLAFDRPVTLPGAGLIERADLVRFDATSLGTTTAGTFSVYFDGSDVGLTTSGEYLDAVELLADGRLLVSTLAAVSVPGVVGGGEDLLVFSPTALGAATTGTYAMYFDGSDVALTASTEKVDAAAVTAAGHIDLSTAGSFSVPGVSGAREDVFTCAPSSTGATTTCNWAPALTVDGSEWGLAAGDVDAVERP